MRYAVVAVGKLKEKFWVQACAEYVKRLGAYAKVEMREVADIDPARAGGVEASRAREGQEILAAIPARSHVILLAIEGKQRSSEQFSAHLDELALRGKSDLTFVIGGSDGVSPEVRARVRCYPIKGMEYERHLYLCYRKELYFARFMEDFLAIVRSKL